MANGNYVSAVAYTIKKYAEITYSGLLVGNFGFRSAMVGMLVFYYESGEPEGETVRRCDCWRTDWNCRQITTR